MTAPPQAQAHNLAMAILTDIACLSPLDHQCVGRTLPFATPDLAISAILMAKQTKLSVNRKLRHALSPVSTSLKREGFDGCKQGCPVLRHDRPAMQDAPRREPARFGVEHRSSSAACAGLTCRV
jgi:hypothetical protein